MRNCGRKGSVRQPRRLSSVPCIWGSKMLTAPVRFGPEFGPGLAHTWVRSFLIFGSARGSVRPLFSLFGKKFGSVATNNVLSTSRRPPPHPSGDEEANAKHTETLITPRSSLLGLVAAPIASLLPIFSRGAADHVPSKRQASSCFL